VVCSDLGFFFFFFHESTIESFINHRDEYSMKLN